MGYGHGLWVRPSRPWTWVVIVVLEKVVSQKCGEMKVPVLLGDLGLNLDEGIKSLSRGECDDLAGVYSPTSLSNE